MKSVGASRDMIVEQLLRDAAAHDAERYDEVGRRFDAVEHALPRDGGAGLPRLRVALTFWDAWIDARNRGWSWSGSPGSPADIAKSEWPALARAVAADLAADREISDPRVRERFDVQARGTRSGRAADLAARLADV